MHHAWLETSGNRHLVRGIHFSIGRDAECSLVLTDTSVSRDHAQLTFGDASWLLWDNGSKNGTFCEQRKLGRDPVKLDGGELLRFGTVEARFSVEPAANDTTEPSGTRFLGPT